MRAKLGPHLGGAAAAPATCIEPNALLTANLSYQEIEVLGLKPRGVFLLSIPALLEVLRRTPVVKQLWDIVLAPGGTLRGRQTLPGSSYFSKPHSGLGALGWGVPRMVVFRQVWVPDTPPTRFLPLIDINEAYTLCSGAQGALWGPWTVWVCCGAPTAKGRQFVGWSPCSPCRCDDPGPMFVASNTFNWPCYGYALVRERGGHGAGIGGRLTVTVGLCHL